MTCREVSDAIGVPQTTLWNMAQREGFKFAADLRPASYAVQFALECLADPRS